MDIITIIILLILILFVVVYWLRGKLVSLLSNSIHLIFVLSIVLVLTGLFLPQIHEITADMFLKSAGTYNNIVDIDKALPLQNLIDAPGNIFDQFKDLFNPQQEDKDNNQNTGFFEENLYPSILSVTAALIRIFSIIIGFLGMGLVIYMSYIFSSTLDLERLKRKNIDLEERIKILEQNLQLRQL